MRVTLTSAKVKSQSERATVLWVTGYVTDEMGRARFSGTHVLAEGNDVPDQAVKFECPETLDREVLAIEVADQLIVKFPALVEREMKRICE